MKKTKILVTIIALYSFSPLAVEASNQTDETISLHVQATYIGQSKSSFNKSPYASKNSLSADSSYGYTFTNTYFLGFRPFENTELFFNPEITQGVPLDEKLVGLGSFYNGEITRAAGNRPKIYRQRLFLRQTFNIGGDLERLESKANQHAHLVKKKRFVLTAGNFSTLDILDQNIYAKDPRTQFMNWGNMTYAAYDYAADSRGFGWGVFGELYLNDWVYRFGRMTPPKEPNMLPIDPKFMKHYGDQFELEKSYQIINRPGKFRILGYRNRQIMAKYSSATNYLKSSPICANYLEDSNQAIFCVRDKERYKYGIGVNVEQQFNDQMGGFLRLMWSDGKTETLAFGEVDQSLSLGLSVKGKSWNRPQDTFGIAYLRNRLSPDRRQYLKSGGMSFFIGDTSSVGSLTLKYSDEQIVESYYSWHIFKLFDLAANYQMISNPAYNSDRGPIKIYGVRVHFEY